MTLVTDLPLVDPKPFFSYKLPKGLELRLDREGDSLVVWDPVNLLHVVIPVPAKRSHLRDLKAALSNMKGAREYVKAGGTIST